MVDRSRNALDIRTRPPLDFFRVNFRGTGSDGSVRIESRLNTKEKRKGDRLDGKRVEEVAEGGGKNKKTWKDREVGTRFLKVELPRVREREVSRGRGGERDRVDRVRQKERG